MVEWPLPRVVVSVLDAAASRKAARSGPVGGRPSKRLRRRERREELPRGS
jgi:hypothetical protein